MEKSRYSFAIVSTGRRPDKTTEPQMVITTTKGTFKFNGSATRLIGLQHGDHVALVNNEEHISRAIAAEEVEESTPITWGVMKGGLVLGKDGKPVQCVRKLTTVEKEELVEANEVDDDGNVLPQYEDKVAGFKLAATNKSMGLGNTLQGSDSMNYVQLGGNTDETMVYSIETDPTPVDMDGETAEIFVLEKTGTVPKIQRG
ncbi:hypothetical protein LCGC14_1684430 [marine sediment metagenome]|uniref:Uncharacterized protein n=1 Tax=marine sediment metagenome TaxID=412755 RepID=A0A0F9HN66_9ZZZZ